MKTILSDRDFDGYSFPESVQIKKVTPRNLAKFDHDANVIAIVGSRAMAAICANLDFPSLKLYQLTSAGYDGVPLSAFSKKGVVVANAGAVYSVPIGETVVFSMLLIAKKLRRNPCNRRFKFVRHYKQITELMGKQTLILGAGNIGTAIAERLKGFDMVIDAYDPYCPKKEQYSRILRSRKELMENIGLYDYVISTLPDSATTRHMINHALLESMKCSAILINVGRRAAVSEADLYEALRKKQIGGAVLDIFEKLPNPITNRFRRLRNVVVLPGVSAISNEVNIRLRHHIYKNLCNLFEGNPVCNAINEVE